MGEEFLLWIYNIDFTVFFSIYHMLKRKRAFQWNEEKKQPTLYSNIPNSRLIRSKVIFAVIKIFFIHLMEREKIYEICLFTQLNSLCGRCNKIINRKGSAANVHTSTHFDAWILKKKMSSTETDVLLAALACTWFRIGLVGCFFFCYSGFTFPLQGNQIHKGWLIGCLLFAVDKQCK